MPLPASGVLSMSDIVAEFGGAAPHGLTEYYGAASGIPASGQISIADFYGKSNYAFQAAITTGTNGVNQTGFRTDNIWNGSQFGRVYGDADTTFIGNAPSTGIHLKGVWYSPANDVFAEFIFSSAPIDLPNDWADGLVMADGTVLSWPGVTYPPINGSGGGYLWDQFRWTGFSLAQCQAMIPSGTWDFAINTVNY